MKMTHAFPTTDDPRNSNPRATSVRIGTRNADRLYNQRRHDLRTGKLPGYVDPDRIDLNRLLIPYPRVSEIRDICAERRAQRDTVRAMSRTTSIAMTGIITFGSEAAEMFGRLEPGLQDTAFVALAEAVAAKLKTTLAGLVVHLDETTIHAHFEVVGYDLEGTPLSQSTRPRILSELQDLAAEIMAQHCPGIERGRRYGERVSAGAEFRDTLHRSVRALHRELPFELAEARAEIAAASQELAGVTVQAENVKTEVARGEAEKAALAEAQVRAEAQITEAQERVTEMENRLVKARADAASAGEDVDKQRKIAKRLQTYGKRLEDRQSELMVAIAGLKEVKRKIAAEATADAIALGAQKALLVSAKEATVEARGATVAAFAEAEEITAKARDDAAQITAAARQAADVIVEQGQRRVARVINGLETIAREVEAATITIAKNGSPAGSAPDLFKDAPSLVVRMATRFGKIFDKLRATVRRASAEEQQALKARREAEEARNVYLQGVALQDILRETAEAKLSVLDHHLAALLDRTRGKLLDPVLLDVFGALRDGVDGLAHGPEWDAVDDFDLGIS